MALATTIISAFVFFLFAGLPVFYVLLLSCIIYLFFTGDFTLLSMLPKKMFEGMDNFVIMAIPLFMMTGEVMNTGGVTKVLVKFSQMLIGRVRGALAYVNVIGSTFFAGITGSALSDISALGSILIPAMEEEGYDREFATAITAASSLQGPLIPPSLPAVTVAAVTGVSTGALFLGSAVPGLLLGLGCCIITYFLAKKRNYPASDVHYTFKEIIQTLIKAFFPLMTPVIILGGMLSGFFTPTEAASVAVIYAYFVSYFYEKIRIKDIFKMLKNTVILFSGIYFIIAASKIFGYVLAVENIPARLAEMLFSISTNTNVLLVIVNIFLLIWGMFLDNGPAIMILMPILYPVMTGLGVNPVHFCAVVVLNLMIGLLTPPFGSGLFTAQGIGNVSFEALVKELVPFLIMDIIVLFIITFIPALTITIPRMMGLIP